MCRMSNLSYFLILNKHLDTTTNFNLTLLHWKTLNKFDFTIWRKLHKFKLFQISWKRSEKGGQLRKNITDFWFYCNQKQRWKTVYMPLLNKSWNVGILFQKNSIQQTCYYNFLNYETIFTKQKSIEIFCSPHVSPFTHTLWYCCLHC